MYNKSLIIALILAVAQPSQAQDIRPFLEVNRTTADMVYVSEAKAGVTLTSFSSPSIVKVSIGYRAYDVYFDEDIIDLAINDNDFSGGTFNFGVEIAGKSRISPYLGFGVEVKENDFWQDGIDLALESIGIESSSGIRYDELGAYEEENHIYLNANIGLQAYINQNIYAKAFYQYNYLDDFSEGYQHVNSLGFAIGVDF